jgi:trehalose utilization protein
VFVSWFSGGEIFRSGCCFYRGRGRIFYFQPGHETLPTYYNREIQKVLINAVKWACPENKDKEDRKCHHVPPVIARVE